MEKWMQVEFSSLVTIFCKSSSLNQLWFCRFPFTDAIFDINTVLDTYLVYDDEENPIRPSFYAFGAGEFEIQV